MQEVEVLSLSVNNIRGLADFAFCPSLRELYLRRNSISDPAEVLHLQGLTALRTLWLSDNPVASTPNYRAFVIANLPQLTKLDDKPIEEAERAAANRAGLARGGPVAAPREEPVRREPAPQPQPISMEEPTPVAVQHYQPPKQAHHHYQPPRQMSRAPQADRAPVEPRPVARAPAPAPAHAQPEADGMAAFQRQDAVFHAVVTLLPELSAGQLEMLGDIVGRKLRREW